MYERMTLVFLPENLEISPSETNVSGQHWSRLLRKAHNTQVLIKNSHRRPLRGADAGHSWNITFAVDACSQLSLGRHHCWFSMAIASAGCGLAQAKATAAAAEGMGRNPGASAAIRFALLLGLVLIESLALYTLVIIFAKVKAQVLGAGPRLLQFALRYYF